MILTTKELINNTKKTSEIDVYCGTHLVIDKHQNNKFGGSYRQCENYIKSQIGEGYKIINNMGYVLLFAPSF